MTNRASGKSGWPVCVIIGDDPPLAAALVWSLPVEQIHGYILFGGRELAGHRRLPGCLGHVEVDLTDHGFALDALRSLVGQAKGAPMVAIGADDPGCAFLSDLHLEGLMIAPVADGQAFCLFRNKWSFYQLCQRLGAPTPLTRQYASKADIDIDQCLADSNGAVVIKPVDQKGGLGVVVVRSAAAFRRLVREDPTYSFAPVIAQAFVAGADIDISVLARDGQVLHRAVQMRDGTVVRFLEHEALTAAAENLVLETGLSGFAHFDARLQPGGEVLLLECNTRPWASLSRSTWCGLNFIRAAVETAQGKPTREPAALTSGVALRPDAWVLSAFGRPSRWRTLGPDQRRLLLGAIFTFVNMGWRDRRTRFASLFLKARDR